MDRIVGSIFRMLVYPSEATFGSCHNDLCNVELYSDIANVTLLEFTDHDVTL